MTVLDATQVLPNQRTMFHLPPDVTYLNCANLAPRLCAVADAGRRTAERMATPWTIAPADWFSGAERLRALFAAIVGADADGVALIPATSYGIATAAANLPLDAGQEIVLLDREFPSNVYAWRDLAERRGARVHTVARPADRTWTEALLEAIGPRTAIVSVPPCHWTDGSLIDLAAVGRRARSVGAGFVVDGSQSVGAAPFDVGAIAPDFLVTVGYKWLLGPYGLAYLYVAPPWRDRGAPLERSWLTREGAEDFASLTQYHDRFRGGARRFDVGGFPQFELTPMAIAALEMILAWGVERIQGTLARLTDEVEALAAASGWQPAAAPRTGHLVGLRHPGGLPPRLGERLAAARVFVSVRGEVVRVAPHLHNDLADLARLVEALHRGRDAA